MRRVLWLCLGWVACTSPDTGGSDTAEPPEGPTDSGATCSAVGNAAYVTVVSSTVEVLIDADATWRAVGDPAEPLPCDPVGTNGDEFKCADGALNGDYEIVAIAEGHGSTTTTVTLAGEVCAGDEQYLTVTLEPLAVPSGS